MAQPLLWGKDLERELIDYMEQNQGEFYRRGGMAKSDTVPAMLTPGEYVVNKDAVARYGAGFFEAINNLSVPAQPWRSGAARPGLCHGRPGAARGSAAGPRPGVATDGGTRPGPCGWNWLRDRKVTATVDARDESRLLQLLDVCPRPHCSEGFPMQLKNLATGVALPLPDDLLWTDEHAWSPAVAIHVLPHHRSLADAVRHPASRSADHAGGRTRHGLGDAGHGAEQLRAWAALPVGSATGRFGLTFADGRCVHRGLPPRETPIEAEPVLGIPARCRRPTSTA
jgi:hypothetical protein